MIVEHRDRWTRSAVASDMWWYSRINELYRGLLMGSHIEMSTEERLELRRMLEETLRLVDDLARER